MESALSTGLAQRGECRVHGTSAAPQDFVFHGVVQALEVCGLVEETAPLVSSVISPATDTEAFGDRCLASKGRFLHVFGKALLADTGQRWTVERQVQPEESCLDSSQFTSFSLCHCFLLCEEGNYTNFSKKGQDV